MVSLLPFLWQFLKVLEEPYGAERVGLRELAHCPGNWCIPDDLHYLDKLISCPEHCLSMCAMSCTAKLRVVEKVAEDVSDLQSNCITAQSNTGFLDRLTDWAGWYPSSRVLVLDEAVTEARDMDAQAVAPGQAGPQNLQRSLYTKLRAPARRASEDCICNRLLRWQRRIDIPIGI